MFAKVDGIPTFKILKKNQNVVDKDLQRAITLTELVSGLYFPL